MKTINILLISLLTTVLLTCCYEDEGNYDYNDLPKVSIYIDYVYDIALGDVLHIEPEVTLSKEAQNYNLAYKWILEGEVIGTERVLDWVSDRFTKERNDNLIFEVTDVDNDISYREGISFSITDKYDIDGYLVLAEKSGKKYLHLIRKSYDEEWNEIYIPLIDPVGLENDGITIPATSFKIHEHYCEQDDDMKVQIMVLAEDQTFELEGTSMKEVPYKLTDLFNGNIPADLHNSLKDVFFMQYLDLINDTKGHLYSRMKSTFEVFHSDYFLSSPVSFEGEVLEGIDIIPSCYGTNTPFCLLHDKNKKRFLAIWDYQDKFSTTFVTGKIQEIANSERKWPEGVPTGNEICEGYTIHRIEAYKREVSSYPPATRYSCIVQSNVTGEYYIYDFGLQRDYNDVDAYWAVDDSETTVDATFEKIPDEVLPLFTNPDNVIYTLPWGQLGWCTLIAQGKELYVYNRKASMAGSGDLNPNPRKVSYAFESEIGVMNANTYESRYMGVAFRDGTFQVLNIAEISQGRCEAIWKSEQNLDLGTPLSMWFHTNGNLNLDWRDSN